MIILRESVKLQDLLFCGQNTTETLDLFQKHSWELVHMGSSDSTT